MKMTGSKQKRDATEAGRDLDVFAPTQGHLANVFSVSLNAINKWASRGMPAKLAAGYSLRAMIAWRFGQREEGETTPEAQRRLAIARASLAELELSNAKGKTIALEEHTRQMVELARTFVGICETAGAELAAKVAGRTPAECRVIIDRHFDGKRDELVRAKS